MEFFSESHPALKFITFTKSLSSYGSSKEEFIKLQNGLYRNTNVFETNLTGLDEKQKNGKSIRFWILNIKSGKERIFHLIVKGKHQGEINIIGYNKFYNMTKKSLMTSKVIKMFMETIINQVLKK